MSAGKLYTSLAMTSTAARGPLATYELLEQILVMLPPKDLFIAQRVSSFWRGLICRSKDIQKQMFLLEDGRLLEPEERANGGEINPEMWYSDTLHLNPALRARRDAPAHETEDDDCETRLGCAILEYGFSGLEPGEVWVRIESLGSMDDRSDSVQDMLLTQPPISAIKYQHYGEYPGSGQSALMRTTIIRNPAGIRLRDLTNGETSMEDDWTFSVSTNSSMRETWCDSKSTTSPSDCTCELPVLYHDYESRNTV